MEAYLQQLLTHSLALTLVVIVFITFLESLALVGLLLPGTILMASIGALIGGGQVNFYMGWAACVVGCLLGDWCSYFIGRSFKEPLHRLSFFKKNKAMMDRTEHALYQHSMVTVLIGRFIGPMRPLVPMVAGMLDLPPYKFALPNIIACLIWPPFYFLPGILAGVAIYIPASADSGQFKGLLFSAVVLFGLAVWLSWRWWREVQNGIAPSARWLSSLRLRFICGLSWVTTLVCWYYLSIHPLMPIYWKLLQKVLIA